MKNSTTDWIDSLHVLTRATIVTKQFDPVTLDYGIVLLRNMARQRTAGGGRVYLIGNGGSLAIASHLATDFGLVGWPSLALTDSVALTSHTNDYGADANFTKQLELLRMGRPDVMIALSCSGKSRNIIDASMYAKAAEAYVMTFSGFEPDNPLRRLGHINFYVPSWEYGFVQLAHESLLHAACDVEHGWRRDY